MTRSHYIPQFILRHFCVDNKITYCDLDKQKIESRNTKSVFSEKDYYPDELEKALCEKIEAQFANLLNNKILSSRHKLTLTADEMLILKKYLLITVFRFKYEDPLEKQIFENISKQEISSFKGDFYENLNKILQCKTLDEMVDYTDIVNERTNPTLFAYFRDILYSYLVFVTSETDEEEFLITDRGYASYEGPGKYEKIFTIIDMINKNRDPQLIAISKMVTPHDFSIFPLSKSMAVITMSPFYKLLVVNDEKEREMLEVSEVINSFLGFQNSRIINPPVVSKNKDKGNEYLYLTNTLDIDDMEFLNSILLINAIQYVACSNLQNIQGTLKNLSEYTRFSFMRSK